MELVLYHPEYGYYSNPEKREIGRKGDFFTSVSVGEMFGFLLSERIRKEWKKWGEEGPVVIVEQGAHDGQLTCDIVQAMRDAGQACDYRIVEPRGEIGSFLREKFEKVGLGEVRVVESFSQAKAPAGFFLCNELLDAFPFHRLIFEDGQWKELRVAEENGRLDWRADSLASDLRKFADELGSDFPDGYETEVCPAIEKWMDDAASLFQRGSWWIIDYGHESEDYFSPSRADGTMRCYRAHRASDDPFEAPGETDITAHVNFSHLQEAAESTGLSARKLTDQHHFLTEASRDWLLSIEGAPPSSATAKRLRQFQTLTHPSLMGQQFKVAEFIRGL